MLKSTEWKAVQWAMVTAWVGFNLAVFGIVARYLWCGGTFQPSDELNFIETLTLGAPFATVALIWIAHHFDRHSGRGVSSLVRNARRGLTWDGKPSNRARWLEPPSKVVPTTVTKLSILSATAVLALSEVADRLGEINPQSIQPFAFFSYRQEVVAIVGSYVWWSLFVSGVMLLSAVMLMVVALICYDAALRFDHNAISDSMTRKGWTMESAAFYSLAWGVAALVGAYSPIACLSSNAVFGTLLLLYFYPHHKMIEDLERETAPVLGRHCGYAGAPPATDPTGPSPPA